MAEPSVKERILKDLDQLFPEQQRRAADLVHGLVSPVPKGATVADLLQVAGTLDPESARETMTTIEEGCELVDKKCRPPLASSEREPAGSSTRGNHARTPDP